MSFYEINTLPTGDCSIHWNGGGMVASRASCEAVRAAMLERVEAAKTEWKNWVASASPAVAEIMQGWRQ